LSNLFGYSHGVGNAARGVVEMSEH